MTLGEVSLVSFYGPNARTMAKTHCDWLLSALAGSGELLQETPQRPRPMPVFEPAAS